MKRFFAGVILTFFVMSIGSALASAIKTWSNGEILSTTDLNANFLHVHSQAEALVTNAKVDSAAAIAHSKMATPALLPKAFASASNCTGSPCTLLASSRVTSVTRSGAGSYDVTLAYTPANASYGVMITPNNPNGGNHAFCYTSAVSTSAPHVSFLCFNDGATPGTANDTGFTFIVLDDDN